MKTTLIAFLLTCATVLAQVPMPPAGTNRPADPPMPGGPLGSNAPGSRGRVRPGMMRTNAPSNVTVPGPGAPGANPAGVTGPAGRPPAGPQGMPPVAQPETPPPGAPPPGAQPSGDQAITNGMILIPPQRAGTNAPAEEVVAAGWIKFVGADINQVLQIYAELVNRTILRPNALPAAQITLTTQTPLTKREAIAALDSVLGLNGVAMINIGEKFVKAVGVPEANTVGAPISKLSPTNMPDLGPYVTHVVQLKSCKPTEVVPALQIFAKMPNSIFPIDSSGILVLRDYTENVKRMLEMIERVDVVPQSEFEDEVIPIKYALASEIASALSSLSSGGGGATVGRGPSTGSSSTSSRGMTGSGFGTGVGSGMGSSGYRGGLGSNPMSSPGSSSSSSTLSDRLQNIIRKASVSGEIQVLGQTKIVADERSNSLLIYASKEDMKTIKRIVRNLDTMLMQVLIETVIIEVTVGPNSKQYGIAYLQHPQSSGQWTGVGSMSQPFYSTSDFVSASGTNASGSLTSGFNYLMTFGQDLDLTLQAVQADSHAKILQRPRIQTSHNEKASIFVGQSRPYPTGSYYGGGSYGSYSSIQQLQIGVELDVTPLINSDGLVVMDIHQKIDSFQGNVTIQGVGDVPITSSKEASAKVAVRNRDTIMLGGLIESDSSRSSSGVPYLMNIPLLGYLFKSGSSSQQRNELIVLIRPTVLTDPRVAALTAEREIEKMPSVSRERNEMEAEERAAAEKSRKATNRRPAPIDAP